LNFLLKNFGKITNRYYVVLSGKDLEPSGFTALNCNAKNSQEVKIMTQNLTPKKDLAGAVMVLGGGIAGMQSAIDLANSGYYVYLVEKSYAIGGMMAQLDKTFPTNDCTM